MSAPNEAEAPELKAGHAPATKVGGMRVVQHRKEGEKVEAPPLTAEEKEEFGVGPPKEKPGQGLVVSGVVTKGDKDFTPEAVKSYHEKPKPIHEIRPKGGQITPQIHQPR